MVNGRTSVYVSRFGSVWSTRNKISSGLGFAELNFEADLELDADPELMAHAAQNYTRVVKQSVLLGYVGETTRRSMSLRIDLRRPGSQSNAQLVSNAVAGILRNIETMGVPNPQEEKPRKATSRQRGTSLAVTYQQPQG